MLIGHGSFDGRAAKFNMPGPDMTAADFARCSRSCRRKQVVFVNTASASGPFVDDALGPRPHHRHRHAQRRRAVRHALRRLLHRRAGVGNGRRATRTSASACSRRSSSPRPRWPRPTSARACWPPSTRCSTTTATRKAARIRRPPARTARWPPSSRWARPAPKALPADPKVRALYLERRELERRVEALRLLKDSMEPARYIVELEKLVTALALKTREIRAAEGR